MHRLGSWLREPPAQVADACLWQHPLFFSSRGTCYISGSRRKMNVSVTSTYAVFLEFFSFFKRPEENTWKALFPPAGVGYLGSVLTDICPHCSQIQHWPRFLTLPTQPCTEFSFIALLAPTCCSWVLLLLFYLLQTRELLPYLLQGNLHVLVYPINTLPPPPPWLLNCPAIPAPLVAEMFSVFLSGLCPGCVPIPEVTHLHKTPAASLHCLHVCLHITENICPLMAK